MKHALGFVIVIEGGDLEAKTVLLVESIRRLPSLSDSPIYAVQPRGGNLPSQSTLRILTDQNARFIFADLNRTWRHHGPMNKVYASAFVEALVENTVETLVFLDSDVLFTNEPQGLALSGEEQAGVTPIAQWRVGKIGQRVDSPLTPYWKSLFEICGMPAPPYWHITTAIDRERILPYFNSGVVAARPSQAIFRHWLENVERIGQDAQMRAFQRDSREFFFLDQTSLAATLVSRLRPDQIRVQTHRLNYPLPAHHLLPTGVRAASLEEISIVHYHGLFSNLYWMDDIPVSEPLASWLSTRLPLRPPLRPTRSAALLLASHFISKIPLRRHHRRFINRIPGLNKTIPSPEI